MPRPHRAPSLGAVALAAEQLGTKEEFWGGCAGVLCPGWLLAQGSAFASLCPGDAGMGTQQPLGMAPGPLHGAMPGTGGM